MHVARFDLSSRFVSKKPAPATVKVSPSGDVAISAGDRAAAARTRVQEPVDSDENSDEDSDDEDVVAALAGPDPVHEMPLASPDDVDTWKAPVRTKAAAQPWSTMSALSLDSASDDLCRGDDLVGSTVSVIDVNGERTEAKVIMHMDRGMYMVRTPTMQMPLELDEALRQRECWVVKKS